MLSYKYTSLLIHSGTAIIWIKDIYSFLFFCRIHTETGNIWTHFFGMVMIVISMLFLYLRPTTMLGDFPSGWEEYLVFGAFFIGAIACLMFSWLFHTCSCHSKKHPNCLASKLISFLKCYSILPWTPSVTIILIRLSWHQGLHLGVLSIGKITTQYYQ